MLGTISSEHVYDVYLRFVPLLHHSKYVTIQSQIELRRTINMEQQTDQLYEEIMQKCIDLGKLIANTAVYQEFKKAEYNLLHNPEARQLVEDLQKLKQAHYLKKMSGTEITKKDQEEMKELENTCLANSQVYNSNNANNTFQALMEKITGKIREGMKSVEE